MSSRREGPFPRLLEISHNGDSSMALGKFGRGLLRSFPEPYSKYFLHLLELISGTCTHCAQINEGRMVNGKESRTGRQETQTPIPTFPVTHCRTFSKVLSLYFTSCKMLV